MSVTQIPRFPLEWPAGWRRARSRRQAAFKMTRQVGEGTRTGALNMEVATDRLSVELDRLGAKEATLSTNVSLNLRGIPRGDENPGDPGAAIYFSYKGRATVLACDTYYRVADNIAALAAHLEHLRAIERHGVGTIEQALAGYKALPADTAANWRAVFGFAADSRPTREQIDTAYKAAAKIHHPDIGGTEVGMAHLNRARDYAWAELDGR